MALEQDASSPSKICMLVVGKEASTLSTLHGIANCVKNGQQEKLYSPTDVSISQQCRPQLLSVKFENLVHSIFRNEKLTLEINVSNFGVLHWQQWQPPACAPDNNLLLYLKSLLCFFDNKLFHSNFYIW